MAAPAPDAAALAEKATGLKHSEAPEVSLTGVDPEAKAAMEKLYNDNGGDLAAISAAMGGATFIEGVVPKDASDFAIKILSGGLLAD
mmetsp:Transcript_4525/g.7875  ORF Transcript_4525/g.7875 Transcript_4525/m.7875 type:complete len:87 (+) Transcript_4525:67-327(+)|eukprot:CAMPEP_0197453760 /NCGR_PEP_ID=MMETSP1175-20131217/35936_1 /TAXON_ID=1003142 /ORGANISM="Triceratium dubium, Strain CCMP147" /LENGTH=86 /DNA_ID=CAMNT_0042987145 /DNA_START=67 /DNA_END=327 /DNA_ORIENTATION=+